MNNHKLYTTLAERINIQLKKELYNAIWAMAIHAKTFDIECDKTVIEFSLCYNPYLIHQNCGEYENRIFHYDYIHAFAKKHDSIVVNRLGKYCMNAFNIYSAFKQ